MATIPKDCCGTDIPILCIASLKRQHIPDNNLREAAAVVTLPTLAPTSAVMKWEHERVSVVGTDVPVREVVPLQEKMTYDKNAVHKVSTCSSACCDLC